MNKKRALDGLIISLVSVLIGLIVGAVIIAITGSNPFKAYYALLQGCGLAPKKSYGASSGMISDFLGYVNFFTPMIFAALSVAVALKTGLFNIGVSGQMLAAGFLATVIVGYSNLGAGIAKPLVILIGITVGAVIGALVGYLKYKFNINEVVSTIMFNYIIQYVVSFFINTYYVDPVSRQSKVVSDASRLSLMNVAAGGKKIDISLGFILAIVAVVATWYMLDKLQAGYEFKAVGLSKTAARYAGINVGKSIVLSMTISGLLAGLAGVTYYLGYVSSIQPKVLVSTGYDAIAVSLLGSNNPFGIVASTMLISLIDKGSAYMKSQAGVESEIAAVITGVILIFSTCSHVLRYAMDKRKSNKIVEAKEDK